MATPPVAPDLTLAGSGAGWMTCWEVEGRKPSCTRVLPQNSSPVRSFASWCIVVCCVRLRPRDHPFAIQSSKGQESVYEARVEPGASLREVPLPHVLKPTDVAAGELDEEWGEFETGA
jgi:hypothetical protein